MRIIFFGTPEFCLPSLEALAAAGHQIMAVVTQPSRPAGRGLNLAIPPVKLRAEELGLKVWQPERLTDSAFSRDLQTVSPELVAAAAFGQYIPEKLLLRVPHGGINLHPSLLPRYRGAAPIARALLAGDTETGVTIHYLSREMDAGEILAQERIAISPEDDAQTLSERLSRIGARLLVRVVGEIAEGTSHSFPQDESQVSWAPKLSREEGRLDWQRPALFLHNRIRALNPWPGAYTYLPGRGGQKLLKIIKSRVLPLRRGRAGEILQADNGNLIISAGEGAIQILVLQREGGKKLGVAEFLRGHRLNRGDILP